MLESRHRTALIGVQTHPPCSGISMVSTIIEIHRQSIDGWLRDTNKALTDREKAAYLLSATAPYSMIMTFAVLTIQGCQLRKKQVSPKSTNLLFNAEQCGRNTLTMDLSESVCLLSESLSLSESHGPCPSLLVLGTKTRHKPIYICLLWMPSKGTRGTNPHTYATEHQLPYSPEPP